MVHFAHDKCSSGIFDYNFKFWILGNYYSCDDWVVNYENQLRPILTQMDIEWTPFSDFVVDVSSQKYEGIFNKFNHPFAAAPLQPYFGQMGVTHMNIDGLMPSPWSITGATAHGAEILNALNKPPKQISLFPEICILLQ